MSSNFRLPVVIVFLLVSSACAGPSAPPTDAPTSEPTPDTALTAEAAAQAAASAATATQAMQNAQMTTDAESAKATATATAIQKATQARATQIVARTATRQAALTATVVKATEQAQSLQTTVEELAADGIIRETKGRYFAIADFDESWAQLNWYMFWRTGYSPTNFVIRADAHWESASKTADWWNAGCGFVFRESSEDSHYLAYLGMDGMVNFYRVVKGSGYDLGRTKYGKLETPSDDAKLMLVVVDDKFTFYVNDERIYSRKDATLTTGRLDLTLLSGTNKDFGTRCKMTNIELWELLK